MNIFLKKILFIYLSEREREHVHKQRKQQAEGEVGSPWSKGTDMGLDPRTPRSQPEPKAGAQPTEHPGAQHLSFYTNNKSLLNF